MGDLTLRGDDQEQVLMCVECDGPCENAGEADPGGWNDGWVCPRCDYPPSMQDTYIVPLRELRYPRRRLGRVLKALLEAAKDLREDHGCCKRGQCCADDDEWRSCDICPAIKDAEELLVELKVE